MKRSFKQKLKEIANGFLRSVFGVELKKTHRTLERKYVWLESLGVRTVIDIGSNEGQFMKGVDHEIPGLVWHAFEPISKVYRKLLKETSNIDTKYYHIALGNSNESIEINVNEHTPSSSILELHELHKEHYGFARKTTIETVEVCRLDDVLDYSSLREPYMIKLDVQGFEQQVIEGGEAVFENAKAILIEVSFQELYKEQALFGKLFEMLNHLDFEFHGNLNQAKSKKTGFFLYADAIFLKRGINS